MGEDNPATTTIQTTTTEEEEEKLDPLKSIKDQIVAYDPEDKDKEADGGNPLTKEQESEALPTLKSGQKYTCFTCQTQDSYKWFKSKMEENVGKVICKRCYHKELVELSDKICAACGTSKTSGCWYRSKKDDSKCLCQKCYKKEARSMVDKTCRACSTTKSSQWTRSKMIPGADLCTQCYRKETKIREGKIDMEQLKKEAGILELRKKSDDAEEAESGASDATAAGGIGGKRTHLPHEVAPPPPKKVKKSYYQKKRPVIIPDISPEDAEKLLRAAVIPKTEEELEEEKKFRQLSSKCCVCNSEDLDNRWKESVLHLEGKLCDICYFKELLIRGGLPLAASN